ncbi:hypothetical protein [Pseudomonas koreensis]|uniref:hypothetical protein n=1 Tax=Pseudomonas koreensis TaxID=198620 RepID=UPI002FC8BD00
MICASKDMTLLLALRKLRQRKAAAALAHQKKHCLKLKQHAAALDAARHGERQRFLAAEAHAWQQMLCTVANTHDLQDAQLRLTESLATLDALARRQRINEIQQVQALARLKPLQQALHQQQTRYEALSSLVELQVAKASRHAEWLFEEHAQDQSVGERV